ncbi:MAG: 3'-5' exonuclease [Candidatus Pacebacteria bacterium]|nr:3'-5' exonuclease [Candidatus Paceibacterota bacterium]MBP9058123.1 3'-5' exonuclease [Candidatus Paceibacterota bacterium]MBP9770105.1 3'-5' exonuclease [Candidatus Paceibacterota bacterium]
MNEQKLAFIDVETTGLDITRHEIIQIGAVIVSQDGEIDDKFKFTVLEELELKVKPERIEDADKTALRVNGYSPDDWVFAYTLPEAMKMFAEKTEGCIMVAHNMAFDFAFITKAFSDTKVENKMHFHKLDTISIAYAKAQRKEDINRFSLRSLCEFFGIENKNAHTALSDCRATLAVFEKLVNLK